VSKSVEMDIGLMKNIVVNHVLKFVKHVKVLTNVLVAQKALILLEKHATLHVLNNISMEKEENVKNVKKDVQIV